ncbi:MAG: hypothetical protein WDM89_01740 [Rhizomicrobium sp.]
MLKLEIAFSTKIQNSVCSFLRLSNTAQDIAVAVHAEQLISVLTIPPPASPSSPEREILVLTYSSPSPPSEYQTDQLKWARCANLQGCSEKKSREAHQIQFRRIRVTEIQVVSFGHGNAMLMQPPDGIVVPRCPSRGPDFPSEYQ